MADQPVMEYRLGWQAWVVAGTFLPLAALFAVLAVINGSQAVPGLLMALGFGGLAWATLRTRTRVGPVGVEIIGGIRRRFVPWPDIERFRVVLGDPTGAYVELRDGSLLHLPWGDHARRSSAEQAARVLVAELERLRHRYGRGSS